MGNPDPPAATVSQEDKRRADLRAQRGSSKRLLTLVEQWAEATDVGRDIFDIDARLDMVNHYQQTFDPVQSQLEAMDKTEEAERDAFDARVCAVKAKLKRARFFLGSQSEQVQSQEQFVDAHTGGTASTTAVAPVNPYAATASDLPLPKLKKFNGCDYLEYPIFINAFKALVDSRNLTKIRKFAILRDSVEGRAYEALQHLLLNDENYDAALKILDDRFMKKRLIFESLIKRVLEVPKASGADALRKLLDSVNASLKALEGLPATAEEIGFGLLIHLVLAKVDTNTLNKWEEASCTKKDQLPNWKELSDFLDDRANMLESIAYLQHKKEEKREDKRPQQAKKSYLTSQQTCGSCSGTCASLAQCKSFAQKSPKDRYQFVKANHYCVRCLDKLPHDSSAKCSNDRCSTCRRRHHTTLHFDDRQSAASSAKPPFTAISETKTTLNVSKTGASARTQVLGTAIIKIQSRRGEWVPARALIDGGSMVHFITRALASKLQLKLKKESAPVVGVCGGLQIRESTTVQFKAHNSDYKNYVDAMVLPEFDHMHPSTLLNREAFDIPGNVPLADPSFHEPQHVDVILGVGLAYKLLMIGQIELTENLLLQKTHLGWVVVGEVCSDSNNPNKLSLVTGTAAADEEKLDEALLRFWETDRVPPPAAKWSPTEQFCEDHFRQHVSRTEAGRFMVRLPFIHNPDGLGKSFQVARTRLMAVERKLATDSEFQRMYTSFIAEYEALGHMSKVINPTIEQLVYLPHHGVLKLDSTTTKLRVVFDASAATSSGLALNDVMPHGPTIQPTLFKILLNFRFHQVALSADICKMYRQILVHPDDRRFQCILWRDTDADRLITYKLNTVTYGTTSAPFLATRCLQELATIESDYPLASKAMLEQTYVDNTLTGAPTPSEAQFLYHEITALLAKAGLEMRKWCSNSPEVMQSIPLEHRETLVPIAEEEVAKTLGLHWSPASDQFIFKLETPPAGTKWTKRKIVSFIAKIFDPLGFLSPLVTRLKIFTQQLWSKKLHWDESLPQDVSTKWNHLVKDLHLLVEIKVPRYVFYDESKLIDVQLHCYADASTLAFGTVFFLRCTVEGGDIVIYNLCSKSKVAPLKRVTLPRLELCGAYLLAELYEVVWPTLQDRVSTVYCWLDAQVALTWVTNSPHRYDDYIACRTTVIQKRTPGCIYRYVPGTINPADILSRGASPSALMQYDPWKTGPEYLYRPESEWHFTKPEPLREDDERLEPKTMTLVLYVTLKTDLVRQYKYHGDLYRVQKTFAFVHKFLDTTCFQNPSTTTELTPMDLERGLQLAVRIIQVNAFPLEYHTLKANKELPMSSSLLKLTPFMDKNGILRVGGRLANAPDLTFDERHPMLLPKNHPLTHTIFYYCHWNLLHAGP